MDKFRYLAQISAPVILTLLLGAIPTYATSGAYQTFEHGRIYSSILGTFAVIEPLNQLHLAAGGTAVAGFPLADEFNSSDRGRCQQFEFALICERADPRSPTELAIDTKAAELGSSGASSLTTLCGFPAKTYTALLPNEDGVIVYVSGQAVYSYGGTLDTFNYYGDRCSRFGIMTSDPQVGGNGPFNTPGAYQDFANGRIYWSWRYTGKFVFGSISAKFEHAGGTNSQYGWPKTEVYSLSRNGTTTNCQEFEGGEICEDAIPAYTAAQQAFLNVLGVEYLPSQIQRFCGNREKVQITAGIAYYDPADSSVRKVTGAIYTAWGENCGLYGLPENDTTRVAGFGATSGYAQRFNNGSLQFDFYHKDGFGVVILEGALKNKYDSKGGLGNLGFISNSYNQGLSAVGRCGVSGLYWNLDNGRIYLNGSLYHLVYGNTPIGSYFFNNGADANFGLPMNDESTSGAYSWQDFSMTRIELWWPGQANAVAFSQTCPNQNPEPDPAPITCTTGQVLDRGACVDIKEFECTQMDPDLHKYVDPANPSHITCAKILSVPYFNQWLESDGSTQNPADGWRMCGAASSTMIAGYFGKLPLPNQTSNLKDYMWKDAGQGLRANATVAGIINPYDPNRALVPLCHDGIFGVTGVLASCLQSSKEGIEMYLQQVAHLTKRGELWHSTYNNEHTWNFIKESIDAGAPVIITYGWATDGEFGHITVVKGYLLGDNNERKLVMNDSFTNTSVHGIANYSYNLDGRGAIYSLWEGDWRPGYLISVGR